MGTAVQILSILDAPVVTGPARGLIHLARHLPPGVHLNVAILRGRGAGPVPRLDDAARGRMTVFELPERGSFDPWILKRALDIARTVDAAVVQSHSYKPHLIAMFLRAMRKIPWVGHHHGWTAENTKVKVYHHIDTMSLPRADRVVAVSESARTIVTSEGVKPERVVLIPNAVDLEDLRTEHTAESARKHLGLPMDKVLGCTVGRLSHEKGQDVLLRALGLLKDVLPDFMAVLAGDGPDRAALDALAVELGVTGMVRFLGHQKDVATVYRACDFMVMPSRSEAMPNVLLESMTLGVPVVATRVGGVPEVAQDGRDAWIVPSDDPRAMADAIHACVTDATERARRAQRARAMVTAQHNPRRRAQRYVQMYEAILGRSLTPAASATAAAEGARGGRPG